MLFVTSRLIKCFFVNNVLVLYFADKDQGASIVSDQVRTAESIVGTPPAGAPCLPMGIKLAMRAKWVPDFIN